jgi:penicillin-insensitive murein endopeptidase
MATGRGRAGRFAATLLALVVSGGTAHAEPPAKELFAARSSPAALAPQSIGFYSKGCLAGAAELAADGPHWQAMRLSRERRYGHPATIAFLKRLSDEAASRDIWPGLLVGDISQARGGPLPFGHASHQVGLDADIWLQPMPTQRLTAEAREDFAFRSVLKAGTLNVDDRIWNDRYRDLIRLAAEDREVQRIFVHPGIKKKLCETAGRDRAWLNKVRPFYGHHEHFHVRLRCQAGSPGCTPQASTGSGDGCDELDWWFNVALRPPPPDAKPAKPKPPLRLADLPGQCRVVLNAPGGGSGNPAVASGPRDAMPGVLSYAPALNVPTPTSRPLR